jgi:hypothetical protein
MPAPGEDAPCPPASMAPIPGLDGIRLGEVNRSPRKGLRLSRPPLDGRNSAACSGVHSLPARLLGFPPAKGISRALLPRP